jgi:hypothetical protein
MFASMRKYGILDDVSARVSAASQALLRDPPLQTEWIDARLSIEIYQAGLEVAGNDKLRQISKDAIQGGLAPLLQQTIERVLAIFGASPASLLSRFDRVAGTTARGVVYRYAPLQERSGIFEMELRWLRDVSPGIFVATSGSMELVFDLCQVKGTFSDPEMVPNGRNNRMRYAVSWWPVTGE